MCKIHGSHCTSRKQSRPKSFARNDLPRWTSSAQPQRSEIWGSVSGRESGKSKVPVKQRGGWQKCSQFKGDKQSSILSHLRKIGACQHHVLNLRNENVLSIPARRCTWSVLKDLSDAEINTLTKSCSLTIVIPANGEVQTHEEATVYVKELDTFLTMKVLENTPAVLSLGKLCDENGYSLWMDQWSKTTSH